MLDTFYPVDEKDLSDEEKKKVLTSLMILAEERDSTIKACACTDNSFKKVSTDSIFMTAVIEAHEGQDVAIVDLPRPFYMLMLMKM